jgi:hypothetical protein
LASMCLAFFSSSPERKPCRRPAVRAAPRK